ncbi:MAG: V-type ATP synthase subunit E [Spirochaetaceae bacterium]
MDAQLKEIIETIKQEGVASAEKQSSEIVSQAEERAQDIVRDAEEKAKKIINDARNEATRLEQNGKEAVRQSGRDLILNLQSRITAIFDAVVKREVAATYSDDVLAQAIIALIERWGETQSDDLTVLLPKDQLDGVKAALDDKLTERLRSGITVRPHDDLDAGFYIAEREGSVYYDFSADGIAAVLAEYLNPQLSEIIRNAAHE